MNFLNTLKRTLFISPFKATWQPASMLLAGACISFTALAGDYSNNSQVEAFKQEMISEHQYDSKVLDEVFSQAVRKQSILDAIARPAEKRLTWKEYQKIFLTSKRLSKGLVFWQEHAETLAKAEETYGVPAEIIVAIIGVETSYGGNKGSFRVVDALSTLSFDYPKRATFFRKELKAFLLLSREQGFKPLDLTGSYAGAMGFPQFMPSSFRAYAVDHDGDGQIDIWNNPVDAIGSVASYFKQHGWKSSENVASRARVQGDDFDKGVRKELKPAQSVAELESYGWQSLAKFDADAKARGIRLQGESGSEFWVTLNNYYVITRYNHSTLYAMAVFQLSERLREQQEAL